MLHVELVHEIVSEQVELNPMRINIAAGVIALLAMFSFRAAFSGFEGSPKRKSPIGSFLHVFDRGVEKVTGGYVSILRHIISRRLLTMIIVGYVCLWNFGRQPSSTFWIYSAGRPRHDLRHRSNATRIDA